MTAGLPTRLDTSFRAALRRMQAAGRIRPVTQPVSHDLELAAMMKALDGGPAPLFTDVRGYRVPVLGNFLANEANCEAAFGLDFRGIREFVARALGNPLPPERVASGPVHDVVKTSGIDLLAELPILRHTAADSGRFITAGIVIVRDPDTGIYNASYHRLQVIGPNRTAIKLDFGRHLRIAYERALAKQQPLPIAVCLGTDIAVHYTAATMGAQMPETADELAVAGGLAGRPIPVVQARTQDLLVPAETEIVLEGVIQTDRSVREGPFAEFVGFLSPEGDAPIFEITALTHRRDPIYHAINGFGRETVMLRKYVLEASLLKTLRAAVPIVQDVDMSAGGLHRFHATIAVKKTSPQHEGLQRNAILAAFGTLKDLELVTVVDDDIDLHDPMDVEYAVATRMEASRDLMVIPAARGHEYIRIGKNGIRAKLGLDATVPFEEQARFARASFQKLDPRAIDAPGALPTTLSWLND